MNPLPSEYALPLPCKIGSYRIEERIGSGGMGVVYRAFDEALQRPLAIKHLLADPAHPTASLRFRREAQAAARLNHPAIVHIYDIAETPEGDWIAMELVQGTPLVQLIRDGSLDLARAVRLGREIAEGLAEAHAHGVIHRDLKAANVMVAASGRAKILDFGLAKLVHTGNDQPDLSRTGIVLGTYHAMSPEQAQGLPLDHRSDLFSFGSLLYEMLTGTSPFRGGTAVETLARICSFQPQPVCRLRPEVPRELSDLIDRLLCKDPDQRPGSTAEVAAFLKEWEAASRFRGRAGPGLEEKSTVIEGIAAQRSEATAAPTSHAARLASSSHPSSERRQVTVLCCELVGRHGPSSSPAFDPESLHGLMLQLRSLAEVVTSRYEGQLGGTFGGHRMLICFGYPQVHEDNASRAVRAALELVDQVARLSDDSDPGRPVALALRIGIHTGPAVVAVSPGQEPLTLGATLDLAVELQSLAEPGSVIVSPATCSLIGKSFAVEALPPVAVQGLAAPLRPHRVMEALESAGDSSEGLLPLVGRAPEVELLLSRWSLAREGHGQAVLICGEAGIGKSRLVLALRERIEPFAAQWWSCFGSPYAQSSPLQPVLGLLRQILLLREGASPLECLASSLRDAGLADAVPLFAPLLDVPLDGRFPAVNLSPERQREKTLEALATLVLETAERQPLVLLIEDVHWLDPTTRGWLDHLIDQVASAPLLLLMTFRLQTAENVWGPRAHLTQITLGPLSAIEAEALMDRVAGEAALPTAVRQQIVARTDGVPLFLEELTKAVLESPAAGARQELPTTLRDSLAARLDRLGTAKHVAQVASVIGRTFTFELLAAVCTSDEVSLQRELRRLVQAELVYRRGVGGQTRYLFKHALVQDAAYDSLLRRERQQIHRRIAETLETRFPEIAESTPELLAHHCTEAGLIEPAIGWWLRAGEVANRRSASMEALDHLDRALRLLQSLAEGPERDRRELAIQIARAAALLTGTGYQAPELEPAYARAEVLAERLGDAEERFWALHGLQLFHLNSGHLEQGLPLADRMLRIAESENHPDLLPLAWLSLGRSYYHHFDFAAAVFEFERAYESLPPDNDSFRTRIGTDPRVVALSFSSISLMHLGQLDRARSQSEQAIALARQLGSPFSLAFACFHAAVVAQVLRDVETVRWTAREAYELSELGFSRCFWQCPFLLAWSELYAPTGDPAPIALGDFESSQRIIVQHVGISAFYFSLHAQILLLQARPRDAWRALDEGLRLLEARGASKGTGGIYFLQGQILLSEQCPDELKERGGPAGAERLFQKGLELARLHGTRLTELRIALSLGKLWKSQGREQEACELVAQARQGFTGEHLCGDLREAQAFLDGCATSRSCATIAS